MSDFKEGDIVVVKSGGPKMTVSKISTEGCFCTWFQEGKPQSYLFESAVLKKVEEPAGAVKGIGSASKDASAFKDATAFS